MEAGRSENPKPKLDINLVILRLLMRCSLLVFRGDGQNTKISKWRLILTIGIMLIRMWCRQFFKYLTNFSNLLHLLSNLLRCKLDQRYYYLRINRILLDVSGRVPKNKQMENFASLNLHKLAS
jgi:hypothetical protein